MARKIHVTKPLTIKTITELLEKNPDLEEITCPASLYRRISPKYIKALKELGVKVRATKRGRGRPRKYSEKDKAMVNRLLKKGKTPKEVSKIMNIPLKTVYYLKGNLKLKRGKKPKYTKETRLKVKKMAKKGVSAREISKKMNIPLRTVYYILRSE
ncbi:Resolvase helix-turn-helix domain protein [Methanothermus fervidus DSM 2088]|uniref:Resolvase helix-turn-helix domain protein n=1 Tax=Methanothermus fervidus (strain ATCC 43054 / DSM 2088 / JCM 10308 / V24 S) TaxID=523846 RepID=E3GYM5_METFV|nr:helix-turn-helix domain-containing protein [Methanothermus fervidus]ADP77407.1 Resolvase helix-turn-helix domain protein [Methanothermus fervidus DSM 2088]